MKIESVLVIGAGIMGHGIAQVLAQAGHAVYLHDIADDLIQKGIKGIDGGLERLVKKEKMTAGKKAEIMGRIHAAPSIEDAAKHCNLAIEAATENLAIKKQIFQKLDAAFAPDAILATNTSSLSVTEIAAVTKRPAKVIGMHFFNPVPVMRLVEIVRGLATDDETHAAIFEMSKAVGKDPVTVQDYPGFVSNRVLMIMINEAVFCLYEGVASAADIDTVMKLGMAHPMGPLALADMIGLDTCLAIMNRLFTGFADPKFRPCPLLVNKVAAGQLGRKTGEGFFKYEG
ncbi:MAG: 3-hydroxybutyryl-CoA dehydrogenase [Deltaproteobacteria bacterium]|nr:3-hydroxybutyryl-CoA dehydrogenase [Deltaproteobacteria bacterium]